MAGPLAVMMATMLNSSQLNDIVLYDAMVSGLAGIFGSYVLMHASHLRLDRERVVALLIGAGLGSLFGPIGANAAAFYFPGFIPPGNYLVDAAAGALVGLLSTPVLGILKSPGTLFSYIKGLLPWGKLPEKTD